MSIFDLSESGHQPMVDYKNGVIIAFNGGIFNAFEYKSILESKGLPLGVKPIPKSYLPLPGWVSKGCSKNSTVCLPCVSSI